MVVRASADDDDCLNKIPIGFAKIPRINLTSSCSPFQEFYEPVLERPTDFPGSSSISSRFTQSDNMTVK